MRRQRDEAFVLHKQELGEADLIVTLLAEHGGKVRGVARAARKSRRRFGGVLEPLTRVRAVWTEREGRELHRIDGLEALRSFAEMQADPRLQAACAILAEISSCFAHEGQPDPTSFRLLDSVLDALERGGEPWTMIRYFEYWMLRIHGLLPELAACAVCARPFAPEGTLRVGSVSGVRCRECAGLPGESVAVLSRVDRRFLERAASTPPAEMPAEGRACRPGGGLELLLRRTLEAFAERRFRAHRHLARLSGAP